MPGRMTRNNADGVIVPDPPVRDMQQACAVGFGNHQWACFEHRIEVEEIWGQDEVQN